MWGQETSSYLRFVWGCSFIRLSVLLFSVFRYQALFNFTPNNPDELQLSTGDVVTVTQRCDDGWYVGVCWRTQKFGTFPGNFMTPHMRSETSRDLSHRLNPTDPATDLQ
ncbi:hypothetical protein FKM82_025323 [Ascaphus truei]